MTDARIVRTRSSLHHAIIDLSSSKPIVDITVSELAERASINRVTFYKHYNTPAETLADALHTRLVESTPARTEPLNSRDAVMQETLRVLDHIEAHRDLYILAFRDDVDGTVPVMLAKQFSDSIAAYLIQRRKRKPAVPDIDSDLAASYLASAITGAIHVWLTGGEMSRERFVHNLDHLLPAWFYSSDNEE